MLKALNARTASKSGLKSLNSTDPWMTPSYIFQSLILKMVPRFEVCGAIACSATPNTVDAMQRHFAADSSKMTQTCLEDTASEQRTVTSSAQLEDTVHQLPAQPATIHRVSVGVLRINLWHLVYCLVWVPSKTLKGSHEFLFGERTSSQVPFSCRLHGMVTLTSGMGDTSDCCGESSEFLQRALLGLRPQEQLVVPRRGTEVSCRTLHTLQTLFVGRSGRPSIARFSCGGGVSQ